jgi:uncharacterized membrane protein YcaP (DUF421 family)
MVVLLVAFRLLGKRAASQMNVYDLAMLMAVSNAVQNAMTGGRGELPVGLYCSTAVVVLGWALSRLLIKAPTLESRLVGKPTLIINDGVLLSDHMRRECLTEEEVQVAIRQHGLTDASQVLMAVFEVDGTISIVPKEAEHHRIEKKVKHKHRREPKQ